MSYRGKRRIRRNYGSRSAKRGFRRIRRYRMSRGGVRL